MKFVSASYWDISAQMDAGAEATPRQFGARLVAVDGTRLATGLAVHTHVRHRSSPVQTAGLGTGGLLAGGRIARSSAGSSPLRGWLIDSATRMHEQKSGVYSLVQWAIPAIRVIQAFTKEEEEHKQ